MSMPNPIPTANPIEIRKMTTSNAPLLALPNEILYRILDLSTSTNDSKPHASIITLSKTCRRLHNVCLAENASSWREACLALGVSERARLSAMRYPGPHSHRCWREVYKVIWCWAQPFNEENADVRSLLTKMISPEASKRTRRALRKLPKTSAKLTVELAKDSPGGKYWANSIQDDVTSYVDIYTKFSSKNHRVSHLDINTGKVSKGRSFINTSPFLSTDHQPSDLIDLPEFKNSDTSGRIISQNSWFTGRCDTGWNVGECPLSQPQTEGNLLVAALREYHELPLPSGATDTNSWGFTHETTVPEPEHDDDDEDAEPIHHIDYLVCFRKSATTGTTERLWKCHLPTRWYKSSATDPSFALTSQHVIIRHAVYDTERERLEGAPGFTLLDIYAGEHISSISLKTSAAGRELAGKKMRYTTGFELPFLVTDSAIISGGPDGKILIWSYLSRFAGIVSVLPDPNYGDFARRYHCLCISHNGRLLMGVLSDRVTVWDMVSKECLGSWLSGRMVESRSQFVLNPSDGYEQGVWVGFRMEGQQGLEVAYLMGEELGENESFTMRLRNVLAEKLFRLWRWITLNGLIEFGDGMQAVVAALFAILVMAGYYIWYSDLPVFFQNLLI